MFKIEVTTKFNKDLILSEVEYHNDSGMVYSIFRNAIELSNEHVKQALIELGWTPPPEKSKVPL